jgi:pilus assembly protein CpaC
LTPELTRPLEPGQRLPLPGSEILDPTDMEFYLIGRIEGHLKDFRSPIRTDLSRIRQFMQTDCTNIAGPVGYTPIPGTPVFGGR